MKCPGCGKEIDESRFPGGLAYCPYCGQELNTAQAEEQLMFCPYCGQELTQPAKFCPHCGRNLAPSGARSTPKDTAKMLNDIATSVAGRVKLIAKATKGRFGQERKLKKLYQQWTEYASLPPEEVPPTLVSKQEPSGEEGEDTLQNGSEPPESA